MIVDEEKARFNNLLEEVENGLRPMYRTVEWQQRERVISKKLVWLVLC